MNVQAMVFGNMGDDSRHRLSLHAQPLHRRERLLRRVPRRTPRARTSSPGSARPEPIAPRSPAPRGVRAAGRGSRAAREALPGHAGHRVHHPGREALHAPDPQRQAHRRAAVKIAVDMVEERLIDERSAVRASSPRHWTSCCTRLRSRPRRATSSASGLPASPGAAVGQVVFTPRGGGARPQGETVILVRIETSPRTSAACTRRRASSPRAAA